MSTDTPKTPCAEHHRYPMNFIGEDRRAGVCLDCGSENKDDPEYIPPAAQVPRPVPEGECPKHYRVDVDLEQRSPRYLARMNWVDFHPTEDAARAEAIAHRNAVALDAYPDLAACIEALEAELETVAGKWRGHHCVPPADYARAREEGYKRWESEREELRAGLAKLEAENARSKADYARLQSANQSLSASLNEYARIYADLVTNAQSTPRPTVADIEDERTWLDRANREMHDLGREELEGLLAERLYQVERAVPRPTVGAEDALRARAYTFLASAGPGDEYLGNTLQRLGWWARDGFKGQP